MTRKEAIEIAVANAKLPAISPILRWSIAIISQGPYLGSVQLYQADVRQEEPHLDDGGAWLIPRKWLEDKGYL